MEGAQQVRLDDNAALFLLFSPFLFICLVAGYSVVTLSGSWLMSSSFIYSYSILFIPSPISSDYLLFFSSIIYLLIPYHESRCQLQRAWPSICNDYQDLQFSLSVINPNSISNTRRPYQTPNPYQTHFVYFICSVISYQVYNQLACQTYKCQGV